MIKLFEGKSPNERNKIIAAGVLGVMALFALYMAFGGALFGGKTTVTVKASPTPKPSPARQADADTFKLPSQEEQNFGYETTPVVYSQANFYAPDAGRNIFAFYEPPPPTPYSPTPYVVPVVKTPTPAPPPPVTLAFMMPQSVYEGTGTFRLEVSGEKFTPDMRIYFNQSEMPTTFVSDQKMVADIPSNMVSDAGPRSVMLQTGDGKLYSNQMMLDVQPRPKPEFAYIGMIARKRHNNDTAYFQEPGKPTPTSKRLNDVVAGRFRLISISASETVLEDVNLGFKHRLELQKATPGSASTTPASPGRRIDRGFPPPGGTYIPGYNPGGQPQNIPGIPNNIPRAVQPGGPPNQRDRKEREDEGQEDGQEPEPEPPPGN